MKLQFSPGQWPAIILTILLGCLAPATAGQMLPTIDNFAKHFGVTGAFVGLVISAPCAVPAIFAVLAGRVIDRWSEKLILQLSAPIMAAGNIFALFAQNYAMVIAARLVEGVAYTGFIIAGAAFLMRSTKGNRQVLAMTLWGGAIPLSFGVSALWVSLIAHGDWKVGFRGLALLSVISTVAVRLLPDLPHISQAAEGTTSIGSVLRRLPVLAVGFAFGFASMLGVGTSSLLVPYLAANLQTAPATSSLLVTGQLAASATATAATGWLLNSGIPMRRIGVFGGVLSVLASMAIFWPGASFTMICAFVLIMAVGIGLATGLCISMIASVAPTPAAIGVTTGIVFQVGVIGVLVGPPMLYGVSSHYGSPGSAVALGICSLLSIALVPIWMRRPKQAARV